MFSGFKSKWTIPISLKNLKAIEIWNKKYNFIGRESKPWYADKYVFKDL